MQPEFQVDTESFLKVFEQWVITANREICGAYRKQGKLLCQRIITGPKGASGRRGIATPPDSQKQGEAAVKRDIYRAVFPIKGKGFRDIRARKRVDEAVAKHEYEALQAMARNGLFGPGVVNAKVQPFSPEMHTSQRKSRGRVWNTKGKDYKFATPNTDTLADYVKTTQGHVGQAKGGWVASLIRLGGRVAGWISRHERSGTYNDGLVPGNKDVFFIMINRSKWAQGGDEDRIIQQALANREITMKADIARMLKDSFHGKGTKT